MVALGELSAKCSKGAVSMFAKPVKKVMTTKHHAAGEILLIPESFNVSVHKADGKYKQPANALVVTFNDGADKFAAYILPPVASLDAEKDPLNSPYW